jgi:hypothetical protein
VKALLVCFALVAAIEPRWQEGALRGFPVLRDTEGREIAQGILTQWIEGTDLHVAARYQFRDGRTVEERTVLAQKPSLAQLRWSWEERRGEAVQRRFAVDLVTGEATARKGKDHWETKLDDTAGAFVGVGFMYAVKNLTERLDKGEHVHMTAIAFLPRPRTAKVTLSRDEVGELRMGGRTLPSVRYVVHPEVPAIARLFVKVQDTYLWFYRPAPPAFLRADGPMAEPDDPVVRIELLTGPPSVSLGRAPPRRK